MPSLTLKRDIKKFLGNTFVKNEVMNASIMPLSEIYMQHGSYSL